MRVGFFEANSSAHRSALCDKQEEVHQIPSDFQFLTTTSAPPATLALIKKALKPDELLFAGGTNFVTSLY